MTTTKLKETELTSVKPYGNESLSKKDEVALMFDNISGKYDLLNHLLSMGIDKGWRKKAIDQLKNHSCENLLDIATGTGDFAISALALNPVKITGIDISEGMLAIGRKKMVEKGLTGKIEMIYGDSEQIPFPNNTFNAATVAFGVRNFENLDIGLSEIERVLKPGGKLVVLEFSKPKTFPVKQVYKFYFSTLLPAIGRLISGDKSAYSYLPESVQQFPDGALFLDHLHKAGFMDLTEKRLTFGIASIYCGIKKKI